MNLGVIFYVLSTWFDAEFCMWVAWLHNLLLFLGGLWYLSIYIYVLPIIYLFVTMFIYFSLSIHVMF